MGLEPESVMRRMLNYRNGLKAESGAEGVTDFGLGPESVTYFPCWQLIAGEQDIVDNTRENYNGSEADASIAESGLEPKSVMEKLPILALGWNR